MQDRPSRVRSAIELIGAVGVIASLIFVAIEIRQSSEAARAAATQQLGQSWIDWNLATATREIQTALLVVEESDDPSKAPEVDLRIAESYVRSLFSSWSMSHYQFRLGVLDPPLWDGVLRDMGGSVDPKQSFARLILWAWPRNRHLYSLTFTAVMDSVIAAHTPL